MDHNRLHTPEGVRDVYNDECERKQYLLSKMRGIIRSHGYDSIETPTFEFFDVFGKDVGTTPSRELYKFFDREGNTLVLRPDMTPSVARAAAKYFPIDETPVRLCYEGNVFINNHSYQGRPKESTQLGVEFLGENSVDADSEIIALVVKCLRGVGLEDFQISIGHADIFKGLIRAAAFDEDEEQQLRELILNRNFFGVEEFLEQKQTDAKIAALFSMLGRMYEKPSEWDEMLDLAQGFPQIKNALQYLKNLYELLDVYGVTHYVSFEMGLIGSFRYYTGIIFLGYTYGSGEPIVKGGRYDRLLSYFGKDAPAIGFALMADGLMLAMERQKIRLPIRREKEAILYTPVNRKLAVAAAEELRSAGKIVTLVLMEDEDASVEAYKRRYEGQELMILDEDLSNAEDER